MNDAIRAPKVRCIDPEGTQLGVLEHQKQSVKLKILVLIWLKCNQMLILLFVKFSIMANSNMKRRKELMKLERNKRSSTLKKSNCGQISMSMIIKSKCAACKSSLDGGDKVKVTLRFRGREMAHQDLGAVVLTRVQNETDGYAKVEAMPKMEGRQMIMVLAPK